MTGKNNQRKTEHSELFEIFQNIKYENQDKRYEATIEILDEFHKRLYAQANPTLKCRDLNEFREYFIKKYSFDELTKNNTKDNTNKKATHSDRKRCITVEPNLLVSRQLEDDSSGSDDRHSGSNKSPVDSHNSDYEMYDYGSEPSVSLVQVEDESVKQFLKKSFAENRKGAHDQFSAEFYKRKLARLQRKTVFQNITKGFDDSEQNDDCQNSVMEDIHIDSQKPGPSTQQ